MTLQEQYDTRTNFVLVHVQQLNFGEWISHILRGSSDYGFNHLPVGARCEGLGIHYCKRFVRMRDSNFSYSSLRGMYRQHVCINSPAYTFDRVTRAYC